MTHSVALWYVCFLPIHPFQNADSYNIRDLSITHWRDQIALVGQEPTLFDVTIRYSLIISTLSVI